MQEYPIKKFNIPCRSCSKNILYMTAIPLSGDINKMTEDDHYEIIDNGHIMLDGYCYCNKDCQFRYMMKNLFNSMCDI